VKIAIAGVGSAAERGHLPAIRALSAAERAQLVGAADPDPGRRAFFTTSTGGLPTFPRAEEMLTELKPDLLVVATEPASHPELVALGLSGGHHVLCEKPLALSRDRLALVATARDRQPEAALVPVHQYRFSPAWTWVARGLRATDRLGGRFELRVDVRRPGSDPHAASGWRRDARRSGGMLIDHGAHFLALARSINPDLSVLAAERRQAANGSEVCAARLALGSSSLDLTLDGSADIRETRIHARAPGAVIAWRDAALQVDVGSRPVLRLETGALSDRDYVDSLYLSLYRRMIKYIGCPSWRQRRTAEAFGVARVGIDLLEAAGRS
jgi:predicted dehydrogenase